MTAKITFRSVVPALVTRFKNYCIDADTVYIFGISENEQTACKNAIEYIFCGFDFVLTFKR